MKPQNYKNIPIEARCYRIHTREKNYKVKIFLRVARINRKECKHIKMLLRREDAKEKDN